MIADEVYARLRYEALPVAMDLGLPGAKVSDSMVCGFRWTYP